MLVATVTGSLRPRLRDDLRLARVVLGVEHLVRDAGASRASALSRSLFSIDVVPIRIGRPRSCSSLISSTIARYLSGSDR
jgi:hypothetical protein